MFVNRRILEHYPRYMHLRLYVDQIANPDLYEKYYEAMYAHNTKINNSAIHIDAGFDLYAPVSQHFWSSYVNKLDFQVKCSAQIVEGNERIYNTGYYMHPRSSISKTQLRLANSTGIVDSGYRGNLIGMFDCLTPTYSIEKNDRLIQICAPGLMPIFVELTSNIDDLGAKTLRGEGGIGSTGR
jgi:dUTP pyrophosphatase